VATVVLSAVAAADIRELIASRSLPADARARVRGRLSQLERFPESGVRLEGRWAPARLLDGPWSWMLHVYDYDADADVVTVLTVQDARTSTAR
jgi:hypothetical protein